MSEIDSTHWTGPTDGRDDQERFGALTHRPGQPGFASNYSRLLAQQYASDRQDQKISFKLQRITLFAILLLFVTPVSLFAAWSLVVSIGHDLIVQDNQTYLWSWAAVVMSLAVTQLVWRSAVLRPVRVVLLVVALAATVTVSVGYVYLAVVGKRQAVASTPERVFAIYESHGSRSFRRTVVLFQRADGSLLGGGYRAPVPYGYTCVIAQPLTGAYGFSWVRLLDGSRKRQRGELLWPIRREECFSDLALSSLPR